VAQAIQHYGVATVMCDGIAVVTSIKSWNCLFFGGGGNFALGGRFKKPEFF
jgi:hypothetical protein